MKAMLLVDIPEDYTGSVISVNLYGRNNKLIHEIHTNKLRPLPKKLNETELVFGEIHGYRGGWNDCLDAITGETE